MNTLKPYIGVIIAGVFVLAFAFAPNEIDQAAANLVIGVAIGGGVGVDVTRKVTGNRITGEGETFLRGDDDPNA